MSKRIQPKNAFFGKRVVRCKIDRRAIEPNAMLSPNTGQPKYKYNFINWTKI